MSQPIDINPVTKTDPECAHCGHAESMHRGRWGPNSIGQHGGAYCLAGWTVVLGYGAVFKGRDGCECERFKPLPWWRRLVLHARADRLAATPEDGA